MLVGNARNATTVFRSVSFYLLRADQGEHANPFGDDEAESNGDAVHVPLQLADYIDVEVAVGVASMPAAAHLPAHTRDKRAVGTSIRGEVDMLLRRCKDDRPTGCLYTEDGPLPEFARSCHRQQPALHQAPCLHPWLALAGVEVAVGAMMVGAVAGGRERVGVRVGLGVRVPLPGSPCPSPLPPIPLPTT